MRLRADPYRSQITEPQYPPYARRMHLHGTETIARCPFLRWASSFQRSCSEAAALDPLDLLPPTVVPWLVPALACRLAASFIERAWLKLLQVDPARAYCRSMLGCMCSSPIA